MRKRDDSSLTLDRIAAVKREARRVLEKADAFGCFPTPVAEVMERANVVLAPEDILNDGFLKRLREKVTSAGSILKRALTKVLGVLDAKASLIYIDRSLLPVKQTFLKLHETGHAFLPWQRKIYAVVEDCKMTLAPEVADEFDREANVFATEVLFQMDTFAKEAADHALEIKTPITLCRRYGASVYASLRRYVRTHHRACAVLVFNRPEIKEGVGFVATLRRVEESESFGRIFGKIDWQQCVTPDDALGAIVPIGRRRFSGPASLSLLDSNGNNHECVVEAFTQTYQVFVLICPVSAFSRSYIAEPSKNLGG